MSRLLEGKVGLVTGAGAGIGRATAELFAREGARVTVADRDEEGGRETVRRIVAKGGEAIFTRTDVSRAVDVEAMVAETLERFGALHCVSNNAAASLGFGRLVDIDERNWDLTVAVTLKGVWLCMKYEIPALLGSGGGSIVNISSDAGLKGEAFMSPYAAAKGGVLALTKTAAAEYATEGVRVNAVCPGGIRTPSLEGYLERDPAIAQVTRDTHAMRRFGEPGEVAEAVTWLCSDRASFVTGHMMLVDGGVMVKSHLL